MKSICTVCGNKKSVFVKQKQKGKGVVDKFIKNLPVEAHLLGTYHQEPYQKDDSSLKGKKPGKTLRTEYTGPGTHVMERYNKGERGINNLDHAAMFHDLAYLNSSDAAARNRADKKLYEQAEKYLKEPNLSFLDKADGFIVKSAMKLIKRKE